MKPEELKKQIKDLKKVIFLCFLAKGDINNLVTKDQIFIKETLK